MYMYRTEDQVNACIYDKYKTWRAAYVHYHGTIATESMQVCSVTPSLLPPCLTRSQQLSTTSCFLFFFCPPTHPLLRSLLHQHSRHPNIPSTWEPQREPTWYPHLTHMHTQEGWRDGDHIWLVKPTTVGLVSSCPAHTMPPPPYDIFCVCSIKDGF